MFRDRFSRLEIGSLEVTLIAILVLILAGSIYAASTSSSPEDDLIAEYRFDAGAGSTAYDAAGGNDGDLINGATWGSGIQGTAVNFASANGEVVIPDTQDIDSAFSGSEIAISVWLYPRSGTDWRDYWYASNSAGEAHRMEQGGNGADSLYFALANTGGTKTYIHKDGILDVNSWNHVVGVYDGSKMYLYVNGTLVGSNSASFTLGGTDSNILLNPSESENAKIDNFRIYNSALSKQEVRALNNQGSWRMSSSSEAGNPSKIVDVSFTGINSSHVLDTSGNNNHGDIYGNAKQTDAVYCKVGRCFEFDGSSGTGVDMNSIWSDHTRSRTFMFWFKESESGASGGDRIITQDCSEWFCLNDGGANSIDLYADSSYQGSFSIDQTKWHHASLVFDESNANFTLYLDGGKKYETGYSSTWSHGARPIVLGGNTEGTDDISGNQWEGRIDKFKVFNKALTRQEINEHTQGTPSGGAVLDMRFNRNGGDKVFDYSGEGNHGTLQPNASYGPKWEDGVTGNALKFDGSDDYIDAGGSRFTMDTTEGITVSAWIKRKQFSGRDEMIFNKRGTDNLRFEIKPSTLLLVHYSSSDSNWAGNSIGLSENIDDNKWHHIVWKIKNGVMEAFLDGESQGTVTLSQDMPNADGNTLIGNGAGSAEYFGGKLDDLNVFSFALSDQEIERIYSKGVSKISSSKSSGSSTNLQNGLVLSQTFDRVETCGQSDTISCPSGMNGEVAVDESGEANHGELLNGPKKVNSAGCKVGGCLSFDGSNDYVNISEGGQFFGNMNKFTVSFWAKWESLNTWSRILDFGSSGGNNGAVLIANQNSNNDIVLEIRNSSGNSLGKCEAANAITVGEWDHWTMSWEKGAQKIYKNGVLVQTCSYSGTWGDISEVNKWLGRSNWNADDYFNGKIDQLRVYNRILPEGEIWKLYTKDRDRSGGDMAGPVVHYSFNSGPKVCILNQGGGLSDGGWGGPSDSELNNMLENQGWNTEYVQVGEITQDGWRKCEVIVFPNSEHYPAFDKSKNFCSNVNGEGTEHDVFMEMKEFMKNGGMWVGTWGAGLWYGDAWDGTSWTGYSSCSQYSGDSLYGSGGGPRCSNLGYNCYSAGTYDYGNINQNIVPALPSSITSVPENNRWASNLDNNLIQAYNSSSGNTLADKYIGIEEVGQGYYFHPGGSEVFDPSQYGSAAEAWNNLLTWYAGDGKQRFWDNAEDNEGTVSGDGNEPVYTAGKTADAMSFDGSADGINAGDVPGLTGDLTVSFWAKPTGGRSQRENPVDKAYGGEFAITFEDDGDSDGIHWYHGSAGGDSTPYHSVKWNNAIKVGKWQHYTFVRDNSAQTVKLYINGKLHSKSSNDAWEIPSDSTAPLEIGNGYTNSFTGKIDDVRIYPYALNQQQVGQVMNSGGAAIG